MYTSGSAHAYQQISHESIVFLGTCQAYNITGFWFTAIPPAKNVRITSVRFKRTAGLSSQARRRSESVCIWKGKSHVK